jgi:hypothetical protein
MKISHVKRIFTEGMIFNFEKYGFVSKHIVKEQDKLLLEECRSPPRPLQSLVKVEQIIPSVFL